MVATTLHINLDLELAGGSLTGRTREGTQPTMAFHGWLGLIGALDALVAQARAAAGEEQPTQAAPCRLDAQENR